MEPNLSSFVRREANAEWAKWMGKVIPKLDWETRLLSTLGVVSAPILTLLVDENVLAAQTATDIGSIVASLAIGYHGNAYLQKRKVNAVQKSPSS